MSALVIETGVTQHFWYHGPFTESDSAELRFPELSSFTNNLGTTDAPKFEAHCYNCGNVGNIWTRVW